MADSAELSIKALENGTLKASRGYSSGRCTTHVDVIDAELSAFIQARLVLTSFSCGRAVGTGDDDGLIESNGVARRRAVTPEVPSNAPDIAHGKVQKRPSSGTSPDAAHASLDLLGWQQPR